MSRAFVNEDNAAAQASQPVERQVSEQPNYVTASGLAQLQAHVVSLQTQHSEQSALGENADKQRLEENRGFLSKLARLSSITLLKPEDSAPPSATQLVGRMELLVPMAGLIDKEQELARLGREVDKLRADVTRAEGKLKNPAFVDKAPAAVVDKERAKATELRSALARLEEQVEKIKYL